MPPSRRPGILATTVSPTGGATVSPTVLAEATSQPVPGRRALRRQALRRRATRRRRLRHEAEFAAAWLRWTVTASVVDFRRHCARRRALALTSTALTACLVVPVVAPEPVSAAPGVAEALAPSQDFQAPESSSVRVDRDGFAVVADRGLGQDVGEGGVVRPVDGSVPSAGNFGGRQVAGCGACSTNHHGTDFAAPLGMPVFAVMDGVVLSASPFAGYGNQVLVRHDDGTETRYGHLSVIAVRTGQRVGAGQVVGAVGSTGISTGPHLHFEVIVRGLPIDPEPWLRAHGIG